MPSATCIYRVDIVIKLQVVNNKNSLKTKIILDLMLVKIISSTLECLQGLLGELYASKPNFNNPT